VRASHTAAAVSAVFEEPNLEAYAKLGGEPCNHGSDLLGCQLLITHQGVLHKPCVQQFGRHRKGVCGVTERQVQGSQPV
jgi:hypothetical protein